MIDSSVLLQQYVNTHDSKAFAELAHRHANLVYGVCMRILGDKDRAAEATQETFFQLLRSASSITGSLSGWLHSVATHKAIDFLRKDTLRRRVESKYSESHTVAVTEWKDLSLHVDDALNQLDEASRALVVDYFLENHSMTEIAATRNISPATVSRRINAAVNQLRAKLRTYGLVLAAAALYTLLQEHTALAAPAPVVRELGKMALAGGHAALGTAAGTTVAASTTAAATASVGLKLAAAALVLVGTSVMIVRTVPRPLAPVTMSMDVNDPNTVAQDESGISPDANAVMRGTPAPRRRPMAAPSGTPAPVY
jgi:RNA polymerase sigma-70 factor, ECF subfamily